MSTPSKAWIFGMNVKSPNHHEPNGPPYVVLGLCRKFVSRLHACGLEAERGASLCICLTSIMGSAAHTYVYIYIYIYVCVCVRVQLKLSSNFLTKLRIIGLSGFFFLSFFLSFFFFLLRSVFPSEKCGKEEKQYNGFLFCLI